MYIKRANKIKSFVFMFSFLYILLKIKSTKNNPCTHSISTCLSDCSVLENLPLYYSLIIPLRSLKATSNVCQIRCLDSAHRRLLWKYIMKYNFYRARGSINFSLKVNPFAAAATTALPCFNPLAAICNCFVPWVEWTHAFDWMHSRHWSEWEISVVFSAEIILHWCQLG